MPTFDFGKGIFVYVFIEALLPTVVSFHRILKGHRGVLWVALEVTLGVFLGAASSPPMSTCTHRRVRAFDVGRGKSKLCFVADSCRFS